MMDERSDRYEEQMGVWRTTRRKRKVSETQESETRRVAKDGWFR
jgi:hypothetical protein